MALTGEQAYALSKKTIQDITQGITMIEGKPCTVQSVSPITGGHRVTFKWTADDGTTKTDTMDVMDGSAGPQGPKGDTGNTGATGPAGAAGANGQAATIQVGTVTSGESAGVTNTGTSQNAVFNFTLPKGDKGDKGDKGADGENGSSFSIRARFSTEEELIAAYPDGPDNPGDAYFVGTTASPDLYVWLIDDEEWHNNGPIAGVKGDKGDTGDDGFSPVASVQKVGSSTTITVRDKTGSTSATVNDGADGQDGADGNDGESAYDIAVDEGFVGTKAEWLASLKGETGAAGTNGTNGTDGVSPVANVTKTNDVYKIHIEDSTGTTEEEIDMSDYQKKDLASAVEGATTVEGALGALSSGKVSTDLLPSDASASNKLLSYKSTQLYANYQSNNTRVVRIEYPSNLATRLHLITEPGSSLRDVFIQVVTRDPFVTVYDMGKSSLFTIKTADVSNKRVIYINVRTSDGSVIINQDDIPTDGYGNLQLPTITVTNTSDEEWTSATAITPQKLVTESGFNYKSGTKTGISISANSINEFVVTFDTPMPDTDYVTTVNTDGVEGGLFASVWNKQTTGFSVTIYNANSIDVSNESFKWQAHKIPH